MSSRTEGELIAGQQYMVICTVVFPSGLTNPITVQWYSSDGLISSGNGVTLGETLTSVMNITSSIEFNPIRTDHDDQYTCRATITSPAPPYSIILSADVVIVVQCESIAKSS